MQPVCDEAAAAGGRRRDRDGAKIREQTLCRTEINKYGTEKSVIPLNMQSLHK